MKNLASLGIAVALVCAVIGVRSVRTASGVAQSRAAFEVEEATIASIHAAITSGQTTCQAVVQAYIDRAKAYNGVCTALVTADGADIPPATGYVRAGAPLVFPTRTVKASTILPGPGSVPGPAARLRPDGADRVRSERHRTDGHAGRDPERGAAERA